MQNPISTGQNTLVNTLTSLTLGYGPGYTAPPEILVQNLAAGGTVILPKIDQVGPTAPGTPGTTPGTGDGYVLYVKNIAQFTTTITPASGDTCDISLITNLGDSLILISDAGNSKWRSIQQLTANNNQIATSGVAVTIAATTRYQILTTAVAVTIPASALTSTSPVSVINESAGSVTVTPASGTIDTTAAFTITTLKSITYFSDGSNFHLINTQ